MDYVEDLKLTSLSCDEFLNGIYRLKECFEMFTEKDIAAGDTHGGNIIVNERIYLIDFDRFSFNSDNENLALDNQKSYERLIWSIIKYALLDRYPVETWTEKDIPFTSWISRNRLFQEDAFTYFENDMSGYTQLTDYISNKREDILNNYVRFK